MSDTGRQWQTLLTLTRDQAGGATTTVQHQEQEVRRSHGMAGSGTPRATERSEGGSKNRRARLTSDRTERITVRLGKAELMELERWQTENGFDTLSNAARQLIHRGLKSDA